MRAMNENGRDRPIWRRIVLPASLVLNIFLIALIAGHLVHRHAHGMHDGSFLKRALMSAEASLSPQDAAAFGAIIRRDATRYGEAAAQLVKSREDLEKQIATEPFDKEAVKRAFMASRESWSRFTDDFGETLVDALASISPEGRHRLIMERRRGLPNAVP